MQYYDVYKKTFLFIILPLYCLPLSLAQFFEYFLSTNKMINRIMLILLIHLLHLLSKILYYLINLYD